MISDWVLPLAVDVASDVDAMTSAVVEVVLAAVEEMPVAPTGEGSSGCIVYPYSVGGHRILLVKLFDG